MCAPLMPSRNLPQTSVAWERHAPGPKEFKNHLYDFLSRLGRVDIYMEGCSHDRDGSLTPEEQMESYFDSSASQVRSYTFRFADY